MASLIHIAEIAALLTAAYAIGWAIGYVARRSLPASKTSGAVPAERVATVTEQAPEALVTAPLIMPVADLPPAPSLATPLAAEPSASAELPADTLSPAALTLSPMPAPVVIADVMALPPMDVQPRPEVPAPTPAEPAPPYVEPSSEPVVPYSAVPAMKPGEAWTGEIRGRAAQRFDRLAGTTTVDVSPTGDPLLAAPLAAAPIVETAPAAPPPAQEYDEDAAMRAIEGGWSRVRARAMPGAPELADVGAAVAAAQSAVEQVLAHAGIDPEMTKNAGKPVGLRNPRPGGKDDLKRIAGLSGLDESTLNNLGVYHFDQIAAWDETEVLWMENHVFARGRIGREDWQGQARTLASVVTG